MFMATCPFVLAYATAVVEGRWQYESGRYDCEGSLGEEVLGRVSRWFKERLPGGMYLNDLVHLLAVPLIC